MSTGVFLAVILAAALHAGWNAIIRFGDDKVQGMLLLSTTQGLMGLALALFVPWPNGETWLWLAASTVLHTSYKVFLTSAYRRGDLSRVYPIARGTAPMIVALSGALVLADVISVREYSGIFMLGAGIVMMAHGVFSAGESRKLLPFAFASALATAGYSLVDGVGARISGEATVFVAWVFFLDGCLFAVWALATCGRRVVPMRAGLWGIGTVAGAASYGAYWIVVWAMTVAPIALVVALRETSVLFAVAVGIYVFHERAEMEKLLAAGLIIAGIILMRV